MSAENYAPHSNSVKGQNRAINAQIPEHPPWADFNSQEEEKWFWLSSARITWEKHELPLLVQLTKLCVRADNLFKQVEAEGDVVFKSNGDTKINPALEALLKIQASMNSTFTKLRITEVRDKSVKAANTRRDDDLIARAKSTSLIAFPDRG